MQKVLIQKLKRCIFVSTNRQTDSYEESANVREQQKKVHDQIQAGVKEYMTNTSNSVLDFALANAIKSGKNNLNEMCKMWRTPVYKLLSKLNTSLFKVDDDKIHLA